MFFPLDIRSFQVVELQNTNSGFQQKISRLEYVNDVHDREINELQNTNADFQQRLNKLEENTNNTTGIGNLPERVARLENTASSQQNDINNLTVADIVHANDIRALQDVNDDLKERLDHLQNTVNDTDIYDRVKQIENTTYMLQDNIQSLDITINAHDNDINQIKLKVNSHDGEISEIKGTVGTHGNDITGLKSVDAEYARRIAQLEGYTNINNVSVGFNARLIGGNIPKYPAPIVYGDVKLNTGMRYSPDTGIFTANTAGLYHFEQTWLVAASPDNAQSLYIMRNDGEQLCESYGGSAGRADSNSPSCSIVVELIPGDRIFVTSNRGLPVGCDFCTAFNGFLIKAYN